MKKEMSMDRVFRFYRAHPRATLVLAAAADLCVLAGLGLIVRAIWS